ncbi:hypothetical protein VTK56DRAFT_7731 [Thermocarpiscus australiensis]
MAKGKAAGGVQNRAIYSRISFLQQAAVFLSTVRPEPPTGGAAVVTAADPIRAQPVFSGNRSHSDSGPAGDASVSAPLEGLSRRLATDMRAVSLKTRIRLKPAVKQTVCKFCDSVLIEGESCTSTIENKSKRAKKPWADILVRKCHTCGRERRYPVSALRQKRKTERGISGAGGHAQKQSQNG